MPAWSRRFSLVLPAALAIAGASPLVAVDGVIEINQARALAGGPGDTAGFPVTISANGSYRLTGNLTVPNENTTAIQLTATALYVTIDLNGFAITGVTNCSIPPVTCTPSSGSGDGIAGDLGADAFNKSKVRVINGTIAGMGRYGIHVARGEVDAVHLLHNRVNGLSLPGSGALVTNSEATSNGAAGFLIAGPGAVVRGCALTFNGGAGISDTTGQAVIANNTSNANQAQGIFVAAKCTVTGNTVANNLLDGIAASSCTVTGNQVSGNHGAGIAGNDLIVLDNLIVDNLELGLRQDPGLGIFFGRNVIDQNNGGAGANQVSSNLTELPTGSNFCGTNGCDPP
jgi:parallel beta-helix repeat protein